MTIFNATLTKVTTNSTMKHNHKINNFTLLSSTDDTSADINKFSGTADVNLMIFSLEAPKMNLSLLSDQVLKIDIDSNDIDNEFNGDPVYMEWWQKDIT
jgi:hypothetical protein